MTKLALTDKDHDLLHLLKANGRAPVSTLAKKLGLSRTTVQDRIRRLEQQGVIAGYGVRLAERAQPQSFAAWVSVAVEPRQQLAVSKLLSRLPEIELLQAVSGKIDFIALMRTPTAEEMDAVLDKIAELAGVKGVETAVILSTKLDRRSV